MHKLTKALLAVSAAAMLFASPASARTNVIIQYNTVPAYGYTQTYYSYVPLAPAPGYSRVTYIRRPVYEDRWDRWDRRDRRHDRGHGYGWGHRHHDRQCRD